MEPPSALFFSDLGAVSSFTRPLSPRGLPLSSTILFCPSYLLLSSPCPTNSIPLIRNKLLFGISIRVQSLAVCCPQAALSTGISSFCSLHSHPHSRSLRSQISCCSLRSQALTIDLNFVNLLSITGMPRLATGTSP